MFIGACWVMSSIFSRSGLSFGLFDYKEGVNITCALRTISPSWSGPVFYVLPVLLCSVLITVYYWQIFLEARKQHIQIAVQITSGHQKGIKAAKVLGIAIMAFIFCTLPVIFYIIVIGFRKQLDRKEYLLDSVKQILVNITLSNSSMNFLIYAWKNSHFRQVYKKLLRWKT